MAAADTQLDGTLLLSWLELKDQCERVVVAVAGAERSVVGPSL